MGEHRRARTPAERFWPKVEKQSSGCWVWQAALDSKGYGNFWVNGRVVGAHRFSYELARGPIPATGNRRDLDHLCRNPPCVNPDHLELVSRRENTLRGVNQVAQNAAKTHCKRGHSFSDPAILHISNGQRMCRICHNATGRASRQRRKHAQLEERS